MNNNSTNLMSEEDTYTSTEEVGYGSRIGNSLKGIVIGAGLVLAGIGGLFWNEGNFVKTKKALDEAEGNIVLVTDISKIDPANEGKPVHVSGDAITSETLSDPLFGITHQGIRLQRNVEYYQWQESSKTETKKKLGGGETKVTTYSYKPVWSTTPIDSSKFNQSGKYDNRVAYEGCVSESLYAQNVTLGAFKLNASQIQGISGATPLVLKADTPIPAALAQQASVRGNTIYITTPLPVAPAGVVVPGAPVAGVAPVAPVAGVAPVAPAAGVAPVAPVAGVAPVAPVAGVAPVAPAAGVAPVAPVAGVAVAAPSPEPKIGDMRVSWQVVAPKALISLVAQQQGATFVPYIAGNGRQVSLLGMGVQSSQQLFATAHSGNSMMTWIIRIVGFIAIGIGLSMVMAPLAVLADVLPILGDIIGTATTFVAFVLAFAISLTTIAIAWLFYRPLTAICLLAVVAAAIYLLRKMRKKEDPAPAADNA